LLSPSPIPLLPPSSTPSRWHTCKQRWRGMSRSRALS
jgi:hypothetical protein